MPSPRSSITSRTANRTTSLCAECTQTTQGTSYQNRSANTCCSRGFDSRRSLYTCHDRMEHANDNGA
eukprot:1832217-Pleurochrysis_carterae.AAC.1